MGYYMFAYGVKTPEIKAVFGSKDEALLQKVKANDTFKNYTDEDDDNETSKALTDIIMGNQYDEEGYIYGYAFIGICAALGVELPYNQEIKFWYETELISRVLLEDWNIKTEIDTELFPADHFHPFSIPEIDDFPMISLLDKERLQALSDLLSKVHKTPEEIEDLIDGETEEEEDKGYSYEHIMGLKENIAFCLENELDMVVFCH
ncbi:MAG: pyruvate dehydrogenase [Flavobacteriaceae bacterium]|nr:pyruvate dehydrogenase [Flavobacteriaceae bacterium]